MQLGGTDVRDFPSVRKVQKKVWQDVNKRF